MKRSIGLFILVLITAVVLIAGWLYYQDRIDNTGGADESSGGNASSEGGSGSGINAEGLNGGLQSQLEEAEQSGGPLRLVVAGPGAITSEGDNSFPQQLADRIEENWNGVSTEVETITYEDSTSLEVLNNGGVEEMAGAEADLFIFVPFAVSDNGTVSSDDTIYAIREVTEAVQENDSAYYISAPQPWYEAQYYLEQLDAVEGYADEAGVTYLNHWSAWPAVDDEALIDYVGEDTPVPTEQGHTAWTDGIWQQWTENGS
ncbi:hypothetical protein CHL76_01355 [Marinococcus halophilus]|uniref:SGNH hydrolase-type esterase domain-containing protein n=1 Tax=Marinococcus halophilus TaxID=1371 RepID=A0A510Y321_MARHA|nr:hypothetical protein [Marinococcus halophilus]OZT81768.1 hypothetical protein CHL76_01355 [Marinococcus halophilus]GEK57728.1 hypothetical protein MHA01_06330 [Marinococcus halophilus]